MLSKQRGEAAVADLSSWASEVTHRVDPEIQTQVDFEHDSNTFIIRLEKGARVLIFRLSQTQVYTDGREAECERTLVRKIKDLHNLI
jgi:hypothetical protein